MGGPKECRVKASGKAAKKSHQGPKGSARSRPRVSCARYDTAHEGTARNERSRPQKVPPRHAVVERVGASSPSTFRFN